MAEKRKVSEPIVPEIEKCPRCDADVYLGDRVCSNCHYHLQSTSDRFKEQPPLVISLSLLVVGVMIAAAATGLDGPLRFFALVIGLGLIASAGLYYAVDLFIINASDRRKKPNKKN